MSFQQYAFVEIINQYICGTMESKSGFIVSARKFRPDSFDMVVGQGSITSTLKNAIRTGHLAQAYLFCGPRGVGKTTCARIFAKTINCKNLSDKNEACNECESCKSFNQNRSFNIHELDAASNNSVEDIRSLIDKVRIPPQISRYSVYIIDEVHMLSQSAFNAFLKTLEEPPKHAIFILATTEKHKILPTILSRCQIFDFNRIQVKDIVNYLEEIAGHEKIDYEPDALNIIAQKADGAMRDALSLFDQIVSFSENRITYQKVIENLNVLDYEYYFRMTDYFLENNIPDTLLLFDEILSEGFDSQNFINGLSMHFRDLLMCKVEKTAHLLDTGETIKQKYLDQSQRCPDDFLFDCLEICNSCDLSFRTSKNQRLHIEIALIKLCNRSQKKNNELEDSQILLLADYTKSEITQKKITTESFVSEPVDTAIDASEKSFPVQETEIAAKNVTSTPSIKDALNSLGKKKNTGAPESENGGPAIDETNEGFVDEIPIISKEEIFDEWIHYLDTINPEEFRMINALRNQEPEIDSDKQSVTIFFRNKALIAEFKENFKMPLIAYLSGKLNYAIEVTEKVLEIEASPQTKYYTNMDKLKYMIEKNPAIAKLKQDFNLDFE